MGIVLSACEAPPADLSVPPSGQVAPPPVDSAAISRAAIDFVLSQTAVTDPEVEIVAVDSGWARVRVRSASEATDPAILFLRETGGRWRGVEIGTGFAPPDLDRLGIPRGVRP